MIAGSRATLDAFHVGDGVTLDTGDATDTLAALQPRYYVDLDAIREPLVHADTLGNGIVLGGTTKGRRSAQAPRARRPRHNTPPAAHPPVSCSTPFSGAATTALAARQLGRSYAGIDLKPDVHTIALQRLGLTEPATPSGGPRSDDRRAA